MMRTAGVINAGAWGTALAQVCALAGLKPRLWCRRPEVAAHIGTERENPRHLPGVRLHDAIEATTDLASLGGCDLVLAVAPAQYTRETLAAFAPHVREGLPVVLCAKGVEQGSLKLMTEVLAETLPDAAPAVLSGPSFAAEVARGLPTAVTLACPDEALGRGETLDEALAGKLSVAEGVASAPAVTALAARLGVEMPISQAVAAILAGKIDIDTAIEGLLSRPLKTEL